MTDRRTGLPDDLAVAARVLGRLEAAVRSDDTAAGRIPPGTRRGLTDVELAAGTAWVTMAGDLDDTGDAIRAELADLRDGYVEALLDVLDNTAEDVDLLELLEAVTTGVHLLDDDDTGELEAADYEHVRAAIRGILTAARSLTRAAAAVITTELTGLYRRARARTHGEARHQGVDRNRIPDDADGPGPADLRALERRARTVAGETVAAVNRAALMRAAYADRGRAAILGGVRSELAELRAAGALSDGAGLAGGADGLGRQAGMRDVGPARSYHASELLDNNTCGPCLEVDGRDYSTLDEARADYPIGTYLECAGDFRCRGTLVAVWAGEEPAGQARPG